MSKKYYSIALNLFSVRSPPILELSLVFGVRGFTLLLGVPHWRRRFLEIARRDDLWGDGQRHSLWVALLWGSVSLHFSKEAAT